MNEINIGPVAFHILKNAGIKIYKIAQYREKFEALYGRQIKKITSLSGGFPA